MGADTEKKNFADLVDTDFTGSTSELANLFSFQFVLESNCFL